MHEVSLVAELIEESERQAGGRPIHLIRVRHASSISEPSLRQAFAALTEGGPLAATTLEAEAFEIRLRCACGFDGPLGHDDLVSGSVAVCPSCGDVQTLKRTAELELLEVRTGG